jgi:ERCC4-type nuclease
MKLFTDSREQLPLTFSHCVGVEYLVSALVSGDYSASFVIDGRVVESNSFVERKNIGDLFSSYTSGYERERAKFIRCKELGKRFILAIEGTASDILSGHTYTKGGVEHQSKKDGMTMLKQIMSCACKYQIIPWFCESRTVMALMIQEYFLAEERMLKKQAEEERGKGTEKKC